MKVKGPLFELAAAQAAEVEMPRGCIDKARAEFPDRSDKAMFEYVLALFRALTPGDYAHSLLMKQRVGPPRQGDVYAKLQDEILWYLKYEHDAATGTVIMSCHAAEHTIELADGRTLRQPER